MTVASHQSSQTIARVRVMRSYVPNKCKVCGKDIFPHWKYCQEHTRGNILLDMDIQYRSLARQEQARLEKRLEALERAYVHEHHDHQKLKEQYDKLQENFNLLASFKGSQIIKQLIHRNNTQE